MIKSLMVRIMTVLMMLGFITCTQYDSGWKTDSRYSWYLTISSSNYYRLTGTKSSDTVDVIQVYVTDKTDDPFLPLDVLWSKQLVYESREKRFIDRFFIAAQSETEVDGCHWNLSDVVFHVIAYDKMLMRVGYFHYYPCTIDEVQYGTIRPIDDPGIYYTAELPKIFEEINKLGFDKDFIKSGDTY